MNLFHKRKINTICPLEIFFSSKKTLHLFKQRRKKNPSDFWSIQHLITLKNLIPQNTES